MASDQDQFQPDENPAPRAPGSAGAGKPSASASSPSGLQETIEAQLCAYVDGELDDAGRATIEKHLAANAQHRHVLAELMQQREWVRSLPRQRAPLDINEMLQAQLERSALLGDGNTRDTDVIAHINRWPQFIAAAAIILLAVGLGIVIFMVLPKANNHVAMHTESSDEKSVAETQPAHDIAAAIPRATNGVEHAGIAEGGSTTEPASLKVADATHGRELETKAFGKGGPRPSLVEGEKTDQTAGISVAEQDKAAAQASLAGGENCWLVVDSPNFAAANEQVTQYLQQNRIEYRAEPSLALNPAARQMSQQLVAQLALRISPRQGQDASPGGIIITHQIGAPLRQASNEIANANQPASAVPPALEPRANAGAGRAAEPERREKSVASAQGAPGGAGQGGAAGSAGGSVGEAREGVAEAGTHRGNERVASSAKGGATAAPEPNQQQSPAQTRSARTPEEAHAGNHGPERNAVAQQPPRQEPAAAPAPARNQPAEQQARGTPNQLAKNQGQPQTQLQGTEQHSPQQPQSQPLQNPMPSEALVNGSMNAAAKVLGGQQANAQAGNLNSQPSNAQTNGAGPAVAPADELAAANPETFGSQAGKTPRYYVAHMNRQQATQLASALQQGMNPANRSAQQNSGQAAPNAVLLYAPLTANANANAAANAGANANVAASEPRPSGHAATQGAATEPSGGSTLLAQPKNGNDTDLLPTVSTLEGLGGSASPPATQTAGQPAAAPPVTQSAQTNNGSSNLYQQLMPQQQASPQSGQPSQSAGAQSDETRDVVIVVCNQSPMSMGDETSQTPATATAGASPATPSAIAPNSPASIPAVQPATQPQANPVAK